MYPRTLIPCLVTAILSIPLAHCSGGHESRLNGAEVFLINPHATNPLFQGVTTASGLSLVGVLGTWQETDEEGRNEAKEALHAILMDYGFKSLANREAKRMDVSFDAVGNIEIDTKELAAASPRFEIVITTEGLVQVRSVRATGDIADRFAGEIDSIKSARTQSSGLGALGELLEDASRAPNLVYFFKQVAALRPVALSDDGVSIRCGDDASKVTMTKYGKNDHVATLEMESDNVLLVRFSPAQTIESGKSALPQLDKDDAKHVDMKKVARLISSKPSSLEKNPRLSAMYDALAVLAADRRLQIEYIETEETFRNRGALPSQEEVKPTIKVDPKASDISGGNVSMILADERYDITFDAGHIDLGKDLDKPESWLYGTGNVGNHVGFYKQLRELGKVR